MNYAGQTGWLEILMIAICVFWLLNAYRRNKILRKIDDEFDNRKQGVTTIEKPSKRSGYPDAEDVDYEEVK